MELVRMINVIEIKITRPARTEIINLFISKVAVVKARTPKYKKQGKCA